MNGKVTQQGHTGNMINDIPALDRISQRFHDAAPGDVILTGTPEGVVNVNVGDEVVTEIDGIRPSCQHHRGRRSVNPLSLEATRKSHANSAPHQRQITTGRDTFETVNPATQETLAEVARGGPDEVNAAVAAAKAAFPAWASVLPPSAPI